MGKTFFELLWRTLCGLVALAFLPLGFLCGVVKIGFGAGYELAEKLNKRGTP
jgi:hypothetical protein